MRRSDVDGETAVVAGGCDDRERCGYGDGGNGRVDRKRLNCGDGTVQCLLKKNSGCLLSETGSVGNLRESAAADRDGERAISRSREFRV